MKPYDLVIKGGTIVTADHTFQGTIGILDEKIAYIGGPDEEPDAEKTMDLTGYHILPGVIDPHIHFQDPGFTHREDMTHGTLAASERCEGYQKVSRQ